MALTVGELNVQLEARTREFRSQLRRAEGRIDRFERKARTGTAAAGGAFRGLGVAIGLVTAALAAMGAAFAAVGIGRFVIGGVKMAATFESIGVALETLTGSAEGAAKVLAQVEELVVATPFALDEVAGAARSVAVVFQDNTDAVAEFTAITADLAAATNRPIGQIGENLVRAFSSGLGAAEVFRDSGITEFIKNVTGETDVTKISAEELALALRQLTSDGGVFFEAAAAQAKTLGGAISNTSIAFDNFQRAVGASISEPLVDFMLNQLQPAFQALERIVKENQATLRDFAQNTLTFVQRKFADIFQGLIDLLRALGPVADAFDFLRAVSAPLLNFQQAFARSLLLVIGTITDLVRAAVSGAKAIQAAARFDFEGAFAAAEEFKANIGSIEERFDRTVEAIKGDVDDVVVAFTSIGDTRESLDLAADGLEKLRETVAEVSEEIRNAPPAKRVVAEDITPKVGGDDKKDAKGEGTRFGERFAEGFSSTFGAAIRGESVDFIGDFAELLNQQSAEALKDSFQEAVDGFGDLLSSAVSGSGIADLFKGEGALGGIGSFFSEKLGDDAGKILGGTALGILGAGIGAFRREQETESAAAQVQSAVDSAEKVRGIVAGPTSIAVAQVDRGISDAFLPTERLLTLIEQNTRATATQTSSTGTGSVPSGGTSEATQALANEGPSLV